MSDDTRPRGIRLCNPCNIRKSSQVFDGEITSSDVAFKEFSAMYFGVRATAKILLVYSDKYNLKTIAGIIQRWAPKADDNDTIAYVDDVSKQLGVLVLDTIDLHNPGTMVGLIKAIVKHENGYKNKDTKEMWVEEVDIIKGVRLAMGLDKT